MAELTVTWLGHAAFRFDTPGGKRVYLDPWLTNPKCPDGEQEPDRCDLIAITHGHDDHVGSSVELCRKFNCPVIAPVELRDWLWIKYDLKGEGQDPNKGGTVEWEGIKITLTDANHSSSLSGEEGQPAVYTGEPVGLVFEFENGQKVYAAGDTNVFGDMQLIARLYQPEVAILPIGGHYTMGPNEAAVALEFLGVQACIPCHYGTFPILAGTPDELRQLTDVDVLAVAPGETISVPSRVAA